MHDIFDQKKERWCACIGLRKREGDQGTERKRCSSTYIETGIERGIFVQFVGKLIQTVKNYKDYYKNKNKNVGLRKKIK